MTLESRVAINIIFPHVHGQGSHLKFMVVMCFLFFFKITFSYSTYMALTWEVESYFSLMSKMITIILLSWNIMMVVYRLFNAPPSSLMDSITNPKVKIVKGEGVGARFLTHNTLGVERGMLELQSGIRRQATSKLRLL